MMTPFCEPVTQLQQGSVFCQLVSSVSLQLFFFLAKVFSIKSKHISFIDTLGCTSNS